MWFLPHRMSSPGCFFFCGSHAGQSAEKCRLAGPSTPAFEPCVGLSRTDALWADFIVANRRRVVGQSPFCMPADRRTRTLSCIYVHCDMLSRSVVIDSQPILRCNLGCSEQRTADLWLLGTEAPWMNLQNVVGARLADSHVVPQNRGDWLAVKNELWTGRK